MSSLNRRSARSVATNRCFQLAHRSASQGWDPGRARLEIEKLATPDLPSYIEIDEARDAIGTSEVPFDVAEAIDLLIGVGFPGIPDDAEHNFGNVHFMFAVAWLKRVEAEELLAVDFVSRHCQLSREFYGKWPPVVPGSPGHPCWASVRQWEAQLHWKLASRRDTLFNLHKAVELFDEARPCYPADDRYHPILLLEAMLLLELSEHEDVNVNLRKALAFVRSAVACFDPGDPASDHVLAVQSQIWERLLQKGFTTAKDRQLLEEFIDRALISMPADSPACAQIVELKRKFMRRHSQWGALLFDVVRERCAAISGREIAQRILRTLKTVFYD
jgi:hypothetical protein